MEIIGEKINTTRKAVEKAVRQRDAAFIQDLARRQAEAGAAYLDVNSGLPLDPKEEANDFEWLVPLIQKAVDLPLCIDSGCSQSIEAALKVVNCDSTPVGRFRRSLRKNSSTSG